MDQPFTFTIANVGMISHSASGKCNELADAQNLPDAPRAYQAYEERNGSTIHIHHEAKRRHDKRQRIRQWQ